MANKFYAAVHLSEENMPLAVFLWMLCQQQEELVDEIGELRETIDQLTMVVASLVENPRINKTPISNGDLVEPTAAISKD